MEYTTWLEFQNNQTQIQTQFPSYPTSSSSSSSLSSYPPQSSFTYTAQFVPYPQNPNPSSAVEPVVNPPGVESYAPPLPFSASTTTTTTTTHLVNHHQQQQQQQQQTLVPNFSYAHNHTHVFDPTTVVDSSSSGGCYWDPNAQNWVVRQSGAAAADPVTYAPVVSVPSNGTEQLAAANPNPTWWTNTVTQVTQPHANGTWKKYPKKVKTKIVQSARCEVCKIECTSKEILDQHKLGKKHKKNIEKLRELLRPPQVNPPALSNPIIEPQLLVDKSRSSSGSKNKKRKTVETAADLEKKKKKVLEGGAAARAVRTCGICNVVCNSETVYNFHLAGQKHAAMVKKTQSKAS